MSKAQQARQLLKGHWAEAVTVECVCLTAGMAISIASIAALHISGLVIDKVIHASDIWSGNWMYALITAVLMLLDWLLISPLLLGRLAFYQYVASGNEAAFRLIFKYFGKRYFQALRWRLTLFYHRLICLLICLTPTALAAGISKMIRQSGGSTPAADVIILLCNLIGLFMLLAGLIISEILMLRRLPAAYMIIGNDNGSYPKKLFRTSAKKMRGHIIEMFQLVTGFGGWFASCLLVVPYLYVMPLFLTTRTIAVRQVVTCEKCTVRPLFRRRKKFDKTATQDTVTLPDINDKKQPC